MRKVEVTPVLRTGGPAMRRRRLRGARGKVSLGSPKTTQPLAQKIQAVNIFMNILTT